MTFDATLFDPTLICLEIDPAQQTQTWHQSQRFATAASRWNAYLNALCLNTLLPWLQEDEPQARPALNPLALSAVWEGVTGSPVALGRGGTARRMVLVPTESIDLDEWRIPQEWVDLPDWIADYYLAVQVNPDDQWVRLVGFVTHRQLKAQGQIDPSDRTYCLTDLDWHPDLNALWVAQRLAPDEVTREAIAPLPTLTLAQAESLLQRLGNPAVVNPRLEVPFERWGALLQHGGWRQQLMQRRRGLTEATVPQWLQSGLSGLQQQLGWGWERVQFQLAGAIARGDEATTQTGFARSVAIADQRYELRILPQSSDQGLVWRFELRNLAPGGQVPPGTVLRLLTEDLQAFENNEDRAIASTEALFVDVMLASGEGIVWEIDPTPDQYDREILRF